MGSGSRDSTDWDQVAGENAYNAFSGGQSLDDVNANQPDYLEANQAAYNQFTAAQAPAGGGFDFEDFFKGFMESQEENSARYAEQREALRQAEEDRLWEIGVQSRNDAFSGYADAASAATSFVENEIAGERSNANLLGIDYNVTPEQQSQRTNDYFATLWTASDQSSLESLQGTYGSPEGFKEFTVTRGDASVYGSTTTPEETLATSTGIKPKSLVAEDDDTLGLQAALGV